MLDKIKSILGEFTEFPMEKMTEESNLIADLNLDSLDVVNITVAFEEAFDIEIPDRDMKKLDTIASIRQYLEELKGE